MCSYVSLILSVSSFRWINRFFVSQNVNGNYYICFIIYYEFISGNIFLLYTRKINLSINIIQRNREIFTKQRKRLTYNADVEKNNFILYLAIYTIFHSSIESVYNSSNSPFQTILQKSNIETRAAKSS